MTSKFPIIRGRLKENYILSEIDDFFSSVKMHEKNEQKCFSVKDFFALDSYTQNVNTSIMEWEWGTNEIYLDKTLIQRQYKKSILLSIRIIEKVLRERFPDNLFLIIFVVQFGKYRNISIRICQDFGESVLDKNLEKYVQPVMQVHLKT